MAGRRTLYAGLRAAAVAPLLRPALTTVGTYFNSANVGLEFTTTSLDSPTGKFIIAAYYKNNSSTTVPPTMTWNGVPVTRLPGGVLNGTPGASGASFYALGSGTPGAQVLGITPTPGSSLGRALLAMYDVADWDFLTYDIIAPVSQTAIAGSIDLALGALTGQSKVLLVGGAPEGQAGPFTVSGGPVLLNTWRQGTTTLGAAAVTAAYDTTADEPAGPTATFTLSAAVDNRIAMGIVLRNAPP